MIVEKNQYYRTLASLREYLVIALDSLNVDHYVRQQEYQWILDEFTRDDEQRSITTNMVTE
jgi:Uma2 family endonuclease